VIEELAGIELGVDDASEFECRKSSFFPPLAIFISQSGETSDALEITCCFPNRAVTFSCW
jgi:glucosamine 6-phosphate synthetase-like amidotransferase/phosphosugar isomerase protein